MDKAIDIENYLLSNNVSAEEQKNSGFDLVWTNWVNTAILITPETAQKFVDCFFKGYRNRPSVRCSNKTETIPDIMIDSLIKARVPTFSNDDISLIRFGHRLSMAAENIIGLILEEYVHTKTIAHKCACCWGSCFPAVDLCNDKGLLLQIKNKSNTENSSSNKIRVGTDIKKWFRMDARKGDTKWADLNTMLSLPANTLSEQDFETFAQNLIKKNPKVLYVNENELMEVEPFLNS